MHPRLELAIGVVALAIAIGFACIGMVFVFALLVDTTSSWPVSLSVVLLMGAAITGIVFSANRSRTNRVGYMSILADLMRASVILVSAILVGALASFFITLALISSSEQGILPGDLGKALLHIRETGHVQQIGVGVFVALQAAWMVPLTGQIYRGGLRRLPVAIRLSHTWTGYAIALSTAALVLIVIWGQFPHVTNYGESPLPTPSKIRSSVERR